MKTPRQSRTKRQRLETFNRHNGVCHLCERKIRPGEKGEEDHVIALACGGEDTDDNRAPAHDDCHGVKSKVDTTNAAKGVRVRQKHLGIKSDTGAVIPGSKRHKYKRKLDGTVIDRKTGQFVSSR